MTITKDTRYYRSSPYQVQFRPEQIDKESGIIKDVVMVQEGPAKGHGVTMEASFIEAIVAYDQKVWDKTGVKARMSHPNMCNDAQGSQLGRFKNVRLREIEQNGTTIKQAIGDLHLLKSAKLSPKGNIWDWTISMAEEDPEFFMSSIVFKIGEFYQYDKENNRIVRDMYNDWGYLMYDEEKPLYITLSEHHYTDLVEAGAATDSLFSAQINLKSFAVQATEWLTERPEILEFARNHPGKILEFFQRLGIPIQQPSNPKKMSKKSLAEWLGFGKPTDEDAPEGLQEVQERLSAAQQRETELTEQRDQLTTQNEELTASVTALQNQVQELQARITELEEQPAGDPAAGPSVSSTTGKQTKGWRDNPMNQKYLEKTAQQA